MFFQKMTQKVLIVGDTETDFPPPVQGDAVQNPEAIFLQSDDDNTSPIYAGKTGVKADKTTGGFKFSPGDNGVLPFTRDEKLKAISLVPGQILYITYLADASPRT